MSDANVRHYFFILTQIRCLFFIIRSFEMQIRFVGATIGRPLQLPEFHADNQ